MNISMAADAWCLSALVKSVAVLSLSIWSAGFSHAVTAGLCGTLGQSIHTQARAGEIALFVMRSTIWKR